MAQHINSNQLHPAMVNQIPMLQAAGLNLTIMTGQQHGLPQFAQGQPGMYQIVQQAPGQLQMQNVVHQQQHQLNNIHLQQQHIQQPQIAHQQVQQLNNCHQLNNHTQIQQIQLHQNQQIHQQQIQQNQHNNQDNNTTINTPTTKSCKKKKSKVNKDGVPAPKRATTAYINFTQWYRESIKKAGRTVPKIGEFGKECAGKWNCMTEEEKKPFTEVAARDRDRYRREMEIYKPARDANKPKRPGTAFMLFMVDFRKEIAGKEPEGGVAALAKLGGERWRSMTDEEKKPYVEQQNECKIRYEAAMEEYRKMTGQNANTCTTNSSGEQVKEENISELNSINDSDTSEHQTNSHCNIAQNNDNLDHDTTEQLQQQSQQQQQNHNSPGSSRSPNNQALSPSPSNQQNQDGQQSSSLNNLAGINMANFTSNDEFSSTFVQQNNSSETNLYQQQHDQVDQQQHLEQHLDQQHDQQDSSQYTQNFNQHYTWN